MHAGTRTRGQARRNGLGEATGLVTVRITSGYFCAALIAQDGRVVQTAPILSYMIGWTGRRVARYCAQRGWTWERLAAAERGTNGT